MKNVIAFGGRTPQIGTDVYIDSSARIIGDVTLKSRASVWPLSVLRADSDAIVVEEEAAILDHGMIEAPAGAPVTIGQRALISHGARLHGATVADHALVGIGAIVLDHAAVGAGAWIAAGTLVPPGMHIPENTLVMGLPGRVVRPLRPAEIRRSQHEIEEVLQKASLYLGRNL